MKWQYTNVGHLVPKRVDALSIEITTRNITKGRNGLRGGYSTVTSDAINANSDPDTRLLDIRTASSHVKFVHD